MTFAELLRSRRWNPIRDCPGRFILQAPVISERVDELLGADVLVRRFNSNAARDTVLVVQLAEGGIISYEREDGTILHTLNTPEGFQRKLKQLGIELDS